MLLVVSKKAPWINTDRMKELDKPGVTEFPNNSGNIYRPIHPVKYKASCYQLVRYTCLYHRQQP